MALKRVERKASNGEAHLTDTKHTCPVFLDFEASSLGKQGYPIEVAWVSGTSDEESYLIKPAPSWTDWAVESESLHGLSRDRLLEEGIPVEEVGRRMIAVLTGHPLYATAPSWDGHWLSRLLRAGGLPRHALRLQDSEQAHREAALKILQSASIAPDLHEAIFQGFLESARRVDGNIGPPTHRALADARREQQVWHDVHRLAEEVAAEFLHPTR